MIRDSEMDQDMHRVKNGPRFQTHAAPIDGFLFPGTWAGERVRMVGPARAIQAALANADLHPEGSRAREFYAAAARLVQAGMAERFDQLFDILLRREWTEAEQAEAVMCGRAYFAGVGV